MRRAILVLTMVFFLLTPLYASAVTITYEFGGTLTLNSGSDKLGLDGASIALVYSANSDDLISSGSHPSFDSTSYAAEGLMTLSGTSGGSYDGTHTVNSAVVTLRGNYTDGTTADWMEIGTLVWLDSTMLQMFPGVYYSFGYFGSLPYDLPTVLSSDIMGHEAISDSSYSLNISEANINIVSEPATMLLLGSGLLGLAILRKKFKK